MRALRIGVVLLSLLWTLAAHASTDWRGAPALLAKSGTHAKAVINAPALTGLWYAPSQNGHGFALTFDSLGHVAATWYVYQGTRQVWLIGSGTLDGNVATLPTVVTSGGGFPPDFTPGSVVLTNWGTLTLNLQSCDRINVRWSSNLPGFSSGSVDVQPLIVGGALPCAVTTLDDRPDTCSGASAVAPNGEYAGRLDPGTDIDYFRVDVAARGILRARSISQLDLVGTISDADCNQISGNDDGAGQVPEGAANPLDFLVLATVNPGTYYVAVRTYGGNATGNYVLNLSLDTNIAVDDYGDSCATATTVPIGTTVNGRIDPTNDIDFFRVVLDRRAALLGTVGGPATLDTVAALYDANCERLSENDDFNGSFSAVSKLLDPGTYYFSVRTFNAQSLGAYTLDISVISNTDDHGDFCSIADPFTPGASLTGQIAPQGDTDYFGFTVADRGTINVRTSGLTTLAPRLTLFYEGCGTFAETISSGAGANAFMTVGINPGNWFVRMRANDTSVGPYRLDTQFIASTPAADEFGNDCASATPVGPYGSIAGTIQTPGDRDVFRLDIPDNYVTALIYAEVHPAVAILDANCQQLVESSAQNTANGLRVTAPQRSSTYYLRVRSADDTTGGYYLYYSPTDTPGVPLRAEKRAASDAVKAPVAAASKRKAPDAPAEFKSSQATPIPPPPEPARHAKAVTNPSSLSGLWYDPAQNGQGVQITFDAFGNVALTWYVYAGTRQLWLIGAAPLVGNRVTLPMSITNGADFPPAFDPATVALAPWGSVTLDVQSCSSIRMSWTPTLAGFTAGSMNLSPLLVSGALTCAVTSAVDDIGDSCATAAAATVNGATTSRIDTPSDQDFFRLNVGSSGTLTVQSSGSSTLNPAGALLDASCAPIASNDDAAGREFSIVRSVSAGTYYVRVASSGAATIGDYTLGAAFAPDGAGSAALTLNLRNDLVYDVDFRINGGAPVRVGAGTTLATSASVNGTLNVAFQLVDATTGDLIGGTFDPVANPSGTLTFTVDNEVGAQRYFAPVISNKSSATFLVGTNMGTSAENRCNCTIGGSAQNVRIGYYLFLPNSNVRAYGPTSSYSGPYAYWGDDTGGNGRPLFNVPLVNLLEPRSGRVQLKYLPQ